MKEGKLRVLLRVLTQAARYLTAWPVALALLSGILKNPGLQPYAQALLAMAAAAVSCALSAAVQKKGVRVAVLRLVQIAAGLVFAAAGVVASGGQGLLPAVCTGLYAALYSALGSLSAGQPLRRFEFFAAAGAYTLAIAVLSWRGYGYSLSVFLVQFLLISALFALEYNFQSIDYLMQRRGHRLSHLPGRMRLFNLALLGGALAVALAVVCMRGVLMQGLGAVLRAVGAVLAVIFSPLRRWWDNIEDSGDPNFGMPPGMEGEPDPDNAFEQLTHDETGPVDVDLQVNLLVVLGVAAIVFCLIVFRRPILEALQRFFRWLSEGFAHLMRQTARKRQLQSDENEYFTDLEEDVTVSGAVRPQYPEVRAWRRGLRAYQKLPDGREKYLTGFALAVQGLQLHGVRVQPGDTALEIAAKARDLLGPEAARVAAESCGALAFSGRETVPAWAELNAALEQLRARKPGK